jgi:molybdate transport system ATP-binding protein
VSVDVRIKKRLSPAFRLDVEFHADDYRCLGILGASGSGKSMTLKCIAGIEKPDEGFISLDGKILFDSERKINLKARARKVGYLFQNYALFPTMSALDNITVALSGAKKHKRRVAQDWIDKFGLNGLEQNFPHQMSGGQQQRVALARMLVTNPASVLLDEPFSALDSNLREYMQLELLSLIRQKDDGALAPFKNSILVTHSRDEVYRLCPSLLIMDGGNIVAAGDTRAIFDRPDSVVCAERTGCKNISKVVRRGAREIFALDWGLALHTQGVVGDDVTHVGIRAHSLIPAAGDGVGRNEVRLGGCKASSGPFEELVVFTNADAGDESERHELWWKSERREIGAAAPALPAKLCLPPESLLLLKS